MRYLWIVFVSTLVSLPSLAKVAPGDSDAAGESHVYIRETQALIQITGDAAELLYNELNVPVDARMSYVGEYVKKTKSVSCNLTVPSPESGTPSNYSCSLLVRKK